MLERAKLQPQQCTVDPLDNAARWSIPIWPLEKILRWLDKICEKYLKRSSSCDKIKLSSTGLRAPFIKIESINRNSRPLYKELSVWPTINLDFEPGGCAFSPPKVSDKKDRCTGKQTEEGKEANDAARSTKHPLETPRMTRKARSRFQRGNDAAVALRNSAIVSGYCEICQLTYADQNRHVQSDHHVQVVGNKNSFNSLDQLISQGPAMDTFLKLNGANQMSPCPAELSGNSRRSMRSIVKLHSLSLDTSTTISSPVVWKGNELLSPTSKKPSPVSNINGHHATRSASGVKSSLEEKSKMLLQQKESLEVQCNGIWSHCYGTRHGGMKGPISGNVVRREQWELQGGGGSRPQRVRRASASFCSSSSPSLQQQQQQLSPTCSDSGHHLRSRGQLWLPSSLLGTTAEDEGNPARTRLGHTSADPQPARTSRDIPLASNEDKSKTGPVVKEETKPLLCQGGNGQVIRRKRLSVEEKLIEDNKAYYKIELKNSKLRSSGYFPIQRDIEMPMKTEVKEEKVESNFIQKSSNDLKCNGEQGREGTKMEEIVSVKFQRVRRSELTLLSDEAESFMFGEPVRHDSPTESSEEEEEEEGKRKFNKNFKKESVFDETSGKRASDYKKNAKEDEGGTGEHPNTTHVVHLKIDGEDGNACNMLQCDESSVCSMDTCSLASSCDTNGATRRKRKRRTHAEAFIHDNLDYYKFEIPGSRLRFQGSILPPSVAPVEVKAVSNNKDNSGNRLAGSASSCSKLELVSKGGKATLECALLHSKVVTCSNEVTNEKQKIVHTQEESKQKVVEENESKNGKKLEKGDDRKKEERDESNVREAMESELPSTMEKLHFSFEVVPQSEPWYQTYTRQDEGEEFYAYSCMSDSCYWKPFLLPYELPSSEGLASGSGCSGGVAGPSGLMRRRRNRFAHLLDKKPRKSPRCHASTLAILSSLMHHRRRKEPGRPKEETQKSETAFNNSAEEDNTSRDAPSVSIDAPFTCPEVALSVRSVSVVPAVNSDFKSESDADLHEIARNIDRMLTLGSEGEEVSGSDIDASGDELKQETSVSQKLTDNKNRKPHIGKKNVYQHQNRKCPSKAKKLELHLSKQNEHLEIDPMVLDELSVEQFVVSSVEHDEHRCRGGPKMDVVTLLDEFSTCRCMDEPPVLNKDPVGCLTNPSLLGESSCNSSECGASSTCETVTFSDGPEGRIVRIHGRKRKRKKNLTGWPAEKQRGKRRLVNKLNRVDERVLSGDDAHGKFVNVSDKLHSSAEEKIVIASEVIKGGCDRVKIGTVETVGCHNEFDEKSDRVGDCKECDGGKVVKNSASEPSVIQEKHVSIVSRTDSLESSGGHSSLEFQPCVRVTKIPDIAGVMVASLPISSSSSSYLVAGISNNRRLRSSSLSSSSPGTSVPVSKRSPSLSNDGFKRLGPSPSKRRASPRKCIPRSGMQWSMWSARKRR
ncbi:uncharacterized protein LOC110834587 isoform X2 [Zootermopsis nevadensis]|uniref:Protein chiffon n=2 Tax=Zootermopsis nevadensis TaxID=136037 RepID=A0A067RUZ0_ZOONE|nr:uncharacterized protein LOC110834587 isoform X2 [Zootermopsis nevadensis]XP_021929616.1 uncharacterized protein LOC110834587 isoform X2 [Zootermopsis nevadensis]XP_021929627.1 uncharacterized protein LOC110834587 isoform X2 [Zootermopsis nevadensis]KDR23669.1 Protein chiffon [Zootermopsis nevadensis]